MLYHQKRQGGSTGPHTKQQPPWRPFESKAFAAGIVLMIAIPTLIAIFIALCRRPRHSINVDDPMDDPVDDPVEESHWMRIGRRLRIRSRAGRRRKWESRLGGYIYCAPDPEQEEEALEDRTVATPAGDVADPSGPSIQVSPTAVPLDRRASMRSMAVGMPISDAGLIQTMNPPSGPIIPQMSGGVMGGGALIPPQPTAAHPRTSISIAPIDRGRSRHASRAPMAVGVQNTSLNENIPLAMPIRTSLTGPRTPRRQRDSHSEPPRPRMADAKRDSSREGRTLGRYRVPEVTDLLSSLRGRPAPQNTEHRDRPPRSPSADGPSDDQPTRPPRPYEFPLDLMRRTRATNQVIQTTQDYIGGYPDIACLIGPLPNVAAVPPSSEGKRRRKAKTTPL